MMNTFIGKNNKLYTIGDLEITNIVYNELLLSMYSLKELDVLYKKYFGDYVFTYPKILSEQLKIYDKSEEVNSFIFKDLKYWFDKNTRANLLNLTNFSDEDLDLVLGDTVIKISTEKLKKFLALLEIYSSKCYVNTHKHLQIIKDLKSVEDLINYDYTKGYPDKIILNE